MKLNPAAFNRFLAHMGQSVLWRASFVCPCTQEHSGAAETNCPICKGKGLTWGAPVGSVVGVTSQSVNAKTESFGAMEAGDVTLTLPGDMPIYAAGRFDRVTLLNATDVFSRALTMGAGNSLADLAVQSITRVFWRSLDKTTLIEGGLPVVNPDGSLTWAANPPAPGTQYSINGVAFNDYFIFEALPTDRAEHQGAPLPRRVQARKWDLLGR